LWFFCNTSSANQRERGSCSVSHDLNIKLSAPRTCSKLK
jgi:hypothetical protein